MPSVVCFGELLLRMSPILGGEWIRSSQIPVHIGGAELNVAQALAKWGVPVKYFTALPNNYLAKEIDAFVTSKNIDTSVIHYAGNRIGAYYLPQGADLKNAGVIYDRAYSSFAELQPGVIDWNEVLKNSHWFHFSAISPALNADAAAVCKEVVEAATALGLTISVDLNYRPKLWKYGKSPVEIMPELVQHCHVVMGNIWAAEDMLGIKMNSTVKNQAHRNNCLQQATETSNEIMQRFSKCATVANTFRFTEGELINYSAVLNNQEGQFESKQYITDAVVDKIGSGDCFMGGLVYGITNNYTPQAVIGFATAAAFGKLFELGDATNQTIEQVKARI